MDYIIDEHSEESIIRLAEIQPTIPYTRAIVEYLVWNDTAPHVLSETIHHPYSRRDLASVESLDVGLELAHAMALRFFNQMLTSPNSTLVDNTRFAKTKQKLEQAAQTTPQTRGLLPQEELDDLCHW